LCFQRSTSSEEVLDIQLGRFGDRRADMMRVAVFLGALAVGNGIPWKRELKAQQFPWPGEPKTTPLPSKRQLEWQATEFQCFFHFGMNTYDDKEWGTGDEDPNKFQPTKLNTTQWIETCKNAGGREAVLVAKHHDGFFLFPQPYTNHSVASSTWRNGKGDVVADFVASCHKLGIRPSFYLSPWDMNQYNDTWNPAYNKFYIDTLTYLSTNYGKYYQMNWDGANGFSIPPSVYDWKKWLQILRDLQPDAVGGGCGGNEAFGYDCGPDTSWIGNEQGNGLDPCWSAHPGSCEFTNDTIFSPYVVDVSTRRGWFFHPAQDFICAEDAKDCEGVRSINNMVNLYYESVGKNAVLLLNYPPNPDGLVSRHDVTQANKLGEYLKKTFSKDFVSKMEAEKNVFVAEIDASNKHHGDVLCIQEKISDGQRIAEFTSEKLVGNSWQKLVDGKTVGYKRLIRLGADDLKDVTKIRITVKRTIQNLPGQVTKISVFKQAPLPPKDSPLASIS